MDAAAESFEKVISLNRRVLQRVVVWRESLIKTETKGKTCKQSQ